MEDHAHSLKGSRHILGVSDVALHKLDLGL
jgi:hypothetical protein